MNSKFLHKHKLRLGLLALLLLLTIWILFGWLQLVDLWQAWPAIILGLSASYSSPTVRNEGKQV